MRFAFRGRWDNWPGVACCLTVLGLILWSIPSVASAELPGNDHPSQASQKAMRLAGLALRERASTNCNTYAALHDSLEALADSSGEHTLLTTATVTNLASAKAPAVALLWNNQFVAVQPDGHGGIQITDPTGRTNYTPSSFADAYAGVALFVAKRPDLLPKITPKGPTVRFEPYVVDFGKVFQTEQVEKTVKVFNTGSAELEVKTVRGTCGCTGATAPGLKIPPGGEGKIKLTLTTAGRDGDQDFKFYVESNAVNAPLAQIHLVGRILRGQWTVYPSSLNFGSLRLGENATRQIQVSDPDGGKVEISEVKAEPDSIKCVLREPGANPSQRTLDVTVSEGSFKDNLDGKIILKTNHPKRPILEIPVTASFGTPVSVPRPTTTAAASNSYGPPVLNVFMSPTKKGTEAAQTVVLKSQTSEDFDVTKAESPLKFVTAKIEPKKEPGVNRVTVTITGDAPAGSIYGDIRLTTTDPKQPTIRLRVRGTVNEQ